MQSKIPEIKDDIQKVLVVDDGLAFRVMMKKVIEMYFYAEVLTAENPKDAIDMLDKIDPALIILDMQMPVMDGFSALRHFRALPKTENTPVIAFSSLGNETLLAELVKWRINDYIKKPSTTELIVRKISPYLLKKRDF